LKSQIATSSWKSNFDMPISNMKVLGKGDESLTNCDFKNSK